MADKSERFIRWQGNTMGQMSIVLGLFATLSVGGLGFCFSLLQHSSFKPTGWYAAAFIMTLLSFLVASLSGVAATVTRLLDFRLTARKVRCGEPEEPLTFFGTDASGYGKATWHLLWCTSVSLCLAVALLAIVCAKLYLGSLLDAFRL